MEKKPVKVIIEVRGGVVVGVSTSIKEFMDIEIVDYDDLDTEDTIRKESEVWEELNNGKHHWKASGIKAMTRQY